MGILKREASSGTATDRATTTNEQGIFSDGISIYPDLAAFAAYVHGLPSAMRARVVIQTDNDHELDHNADSSSSSGSSCTAI